MGQLGVLRIVKCNMGKAHGQTKWDGETITEADDDIPVDESMSAKLRAGDYPGNPSCDRYPSLGDRAAAQEVKLT